MKINQKFGGGGKFPSQGWLFYPILYDHIVHLNAAYHDQVYIVQAPRC